MKTDHQLAILNKAYENGMTSRKKNCPKTVQCAKDTNLSLIEVEVSYNYSLFLENAVILCLVFLYNQVVFA